ncbi:Type I restriction modification DNA specificity domain protein [Vibrio aerogenes CECT 7868]|uniref:Type I restriction modification DNA specificity domain protein n=1 Tax=Vibrio aerogenes CECT 7868 TaxID=1216006 RepID=A0A1M5ZS70_9VIBR|nr:restriction endonuclease subunit S [Vibrio aerogenes]SHI27051.1 Type I restriction modification DNA specificity domain protein [Vibrio aerogenes CECT 7868]
MRSHYKRIGDYVTQIKLKNTDDSISSLKGININKHFMPSVANINGTDLSKYRVVKKNQFAFNPMHVGRDEVLPISMLEDDEPIIVSPAYVVFEVKDEEELLPAYLMMWCRRSEFDRNAWFMTDNSVRGGFSWADFCDMELPVPSIEKQREIVREYNVLNDRIALNQQLTQKLEDTAQAIYKQWFVDFEFPISKEYAESIGKPELEGNPYKSSGGEMEYSEQLEGEIPLNWECGKIQDYIVINYGKSLPESKRIAGEYGVYSSAGLTGSHNTYLTDESTIIIGRKGTIGKLYYVQNPSFCIDTAYYIRESDSQFPLSFTYRILLGLNLPELNEDSAVPGLNRNTVYDLPVVKPISNVLDEYNEVSGKITTHKNNLQAEISSLSQLKRFINTKMSKA